MTQKVPSSLQQQRVIVLGGSSGIGLAVAEQSIAHGADVVIASSSAQRVQQAAKDLGANATGHALDLTDERAIQTFFRNLGDFDHLVFTAGDSLQITDLAGIDLKQGRQVFEIRYWGALAAVKYGTPHIRKGGSVVLTLGIAGSRPFKGWMLGASVCGAVESLTRVLAVELAPIRVNAVSPGVVRTNLWQSVPEKERENMYQTVGNTVPVGRVGEAADIAQAYIYLMQEAFSTGQIVVVDGGTTLV